MNDEKNPERQWMVCAVCGYPLERTDNKRAFVDGGEWGHLRPDQQDHVIIAVDASQIQINQRCDFCDVEKATDVVLCRSFIVPMTNSRSVGHWAACEQCGEFVRRHRWSQLVTRVKRVGGEHARRAPRSTLMSMYAPIEQNMYGIISQREWRERHGYPSPTD